MPTMEDIYSAHPGAPLRPPGDDDRCAGCSATGLSLLACDDIDDSGEATSGRRSRWVIEDLSLPISRKAEKTRFVICLAMGAMVRGRAHHDVLSECST